MSDRENPEKGDEEAKETDTRRESTSIEETEENEPERHGLGEYPVRIGVEDCYYYLKNGFCGYGRSCRFNHPPVSENPNREYLLFSHGLYSLIHRNQMRHGIVQPSPYPGAGDCIQYLQTGQCSYGPKCRFNHPPSPRDLGAIDCRQYLQTGQCSYGSKCRYNHPPSPVLPQWVSRQICKFFQKGNCKYGSGCKFTHSMSGDGAEAEPMRQDTTWGKKRHAAKSSSRPWKRERQTHDLEEHKQKKRKVENLRIDPNVPSGEGGSQTEQRLENLQQQADTERQNREAQEKAQEERRRQIDNERRQARLRLERGQTPDMRPSGSGTRSVEKAVVRYDRDTRFRDENMEATPDRDPIAHAIYWEKKVQELRVRNAEMKQRRANETIQKQRLRNAEMQQRRADKTESRSIEETKGETVDMRPSGSGEKAVVRYDRDTRFWEDKMQQKRLSDALMQHMRSNEIVSRSTDETKVHGFTYSQGKRGQTRPSGSGRWSPVVRYTRSWEENREYLESSGRENEAVQIRDQNETYIQQRQRDDEMQQRRSRETESIFFQQQKNRAEAPDLGYKRRRFDERRHKQEQYPTRPRIKRGVCHFYLKKGWCGYGRDCVFNHPTPSWRFDERRHDTEVPEKMFRVWFRRFLWTIMIIRLEQCMGGGGGGWLSYDERRRNPATREILMPPPRRMEQRDREREVRNEGAS
ncbi:unnamed protein product [Brassica oleracea]